MEKKITKKDVVKKASKVNKRKQAEEEWLKSIAKDIVWEIKPAGSMIIGGTISKPGKSVQDIIL